MENNNNNNKRKATAPPPPATPAPANRNTVDEDDDGIYGTSARGGRGRGRGAARVGRGRGAAPAGRGSAAVPPAPSPASFPASFPAPVSGRGIGPGPGPVGAPPTRAYILETAAELKSKRSRLSLREKLIKGDREPANSGMRAYNKRKAKEAADQQREEARVAGLEEGRAAGLAEIRSGRPGSLAFPDPKRQVAGPETTKKSLHLSESFVKELKQDVEKWCARNKEDGLLFTVTLLVGGEYDVEVFTDLRDAVKEALEHLFEHPELFVLKTAENGQEETIPVETVIRDVEAIGVNKAPSVAPDSSVLTVKGEINDLSMDDAVQDAAVYVYQGQSKVVSPGFELATRLSDSTIVEICVMQKELRKRRANN
ncbi:hypothetical protein F5Y18DRAFT_425499 [Xylariaceae sp. FL1019]|nr:hypothetical protein F5Y18DRAFT_425499 [Xylariaceae sp. FL1019]